MENCLYFIHLVLYQVLHLLVELTTKQGPQRIFVDVDYTFAQKIHWAAPNIPLIVRFP